MKILVPLILSVGLGLGALARVATTDSTAPLPASPSAIDEPVGPESAVAASESPSTPAAFPRVEADPGTLVGRLSAAIDPLPAPSLGSSSMIEGIAIDHPSGTPVAGIRISIYPVSYEIAGHEDARTNLQRGDMTRYIVDRVAEHCFFNQGKREVVTDASGQFRFDGLPWSRYRIDATDPSDAGEVQILVEENKSTLVYPGSEVRIQRIPTYQVAFDVRLPDGSSPPSATITGSGKDLEWTPKRRVFRVPGGNRRYRIQEDEQTLASKSVTIDSDRLELPIVLNIVQQNGIDLTVEIPSEENNTQFHSWCAMVPPGLPTDDAWILRHGQLRGLSSGRGRVLKPGEVLPANTTTKRISPLPPGEYLFAIGRTSDRVEQSAFVTVPDRGFVELSLAFAPIEIESVIEVWVYAPDGSLVENASLSLQVQSEFQRNSVDCTTVKRPDGSYWLHPSQSVFDVLAGVTPGSIELSVAAPRFAERKITLESTFVEVHFAPTATLFLDIRGATPEQNLDISMVNAEGKQIGSWDFTELEKGLGSIESGDVLVSITTGGRYGSNLILDPFWLTLTPGENREVVTLPTLYTLTIDVPDAQDGQELMLFRLDGVVLPSRSGNPMMGARDGSQFLFSDLLPGRYSMLLGSQTSMDFSGMEVSISGDSRVTYSGTPLTAIMIRVSDVVTGENPFEDGDKLIGVDGKEFTSVADMGMSIEGGGVGGSIKFMVIRRGEQIEIETTSVKLQELMGSGAQLLPVAR